MRSTTKVIISLYFPIEHLSVFYFLVTASKERLLFSEMLNILDCLQKLSIIVRKVWGEKTDCQVLRIQRTAEMFPRRAAVKVVRFTNVSYFKHLAELDATLLYLMFAFVHLLTTKGSIALFFCLCLVFSFGSRYFAFRLGTFQEEVTLFICCAHFFTQLPHTYSYCCKHLNMEQQSKSNTQSCS